MALRAPYHFRAWRRHGLEVGFAFDWRGDWRRMLANELHGMRTVRAERRRALADMALPRLERSAVSSDGGRVIGPDEARPGRP